MKKIGGVSGFVGLKLGRSHDHYVVKTRRMGGVIVSTVKIKKL